jgi:prepilin-type processing-associated H-X9-DG protein
MYLPDFRHAAEANFVFVDGRAKSLPCYFNAENRLYFLGHFVGISETLSPNIPGFHDQYLIGDI